MGIDMTYLAHAGVKEMKWGLRRYRNYDGTLTEEGKKRYYKYTGKEYSLEDDKNTKKALQSITKTLKDNANASRSQASDYKKIGDSVKSRGKITTDIKKMSDNELKEKIKRKSLENRYVDEINAKTASPTIGDKLKVINAPLSIGSSLVGATGGALKLAGKFSGNQNLETAGNLMFGVGTTGTLIGAALHTLSNTHLMNKQKSVNVDLSKYSDDDLQKIVSRMNLERVYAETVNKNSKSKTKMVTDILEDTGNISASTFDIFAGLNELDYYKMGYDIGNIENVKESKSAPKKQEPILLPPGKYYLPPAKEK